MQPQDRRSTHLSPDRAKSWLVATTSERLRRPAAATGVAVGAAAGRRGAGHRLGGAVAATRARLLRAVRAPAGAPVSVGGLVAAARLIAERGRAGGVRGQCGGDPDPDVALPWASLLSHGARLDTYRLGICGEPIRVQLTCGVVPGLLSALAWCRERFTAERGERLSLEGMAYTDPTTGLPNRRALYPRTEDLLAAARAGETGSLILYDIGHFKRVNDTCGHSVGDEVLITLPGQSAEQARQGDRAPAGAGGRAGRGARRIGHGQFRSDGLYRRRRSAGLRGPGRPGAVHGQDGRARPGGHPAGRRRRTDRARDTDRPRRH